MVGLTFLEVASYNANVIGLQRAGLDAAELRRQGCCVSFHPSERHCRPVCDGQVAPVNKVGWTLRGVARPRIGADLRLKLAIDERNGGQRERICLALFGARRSNLPGPVARS